MPSATAAVPWDAHVTGRVPGQSKRSQDAAPGVLCNDGFAQVGIAYRSCHFTALRRLLHPD
jgi:hypothetical protein